MQGSVGAGVHGRAAFDQGFHVTATALFRLVFGAPVSFSGAVSQADTAEQKQKGYPEQTAGNGLPKDGRHKAEKLS